jgi:hypothetical protein
MAVGEKMRRRVPVFALLLSIISTECAAPQDTDDNQDRLAGMVAASFPAMATAGLLLPGVGIPLVFLASEFPIARPFS